MPLGENARLLTGDSCYPERVAKRFLESKLYKEIEQSIFEEAKNLEQGEKEPDKVVLLPLFLFE
jgi:hypothetical protein